MTDAGRGHALAQIVVLTEEAVAQCERGLATPATLVALTEQRAAHLHACRETAAATAAERALLVRLEGLDSMLVQWCAGAQRELERTRSQIPTRGPGPAAARVLSDIA